MTVQCSLLRWEIVDQYAVCGRGCRRADRRVGGPGDAIVKRLILAADRIHRVVDSQARVRKPDRGRPWRFCSIRHDGRGSEGIPSRAHIPRVDRPAGQDKPRHQTQLVVLHCIFLLVRTVSEKYFSRNSMRETITETVTGREGFFAILRPGDRGLSSL